MSSFASDISFDLLNLPIFFLVARLSNGNSSSFTLEKLSVLTAHALVFQSVQINIRSLQFFFLFSFFFFLIFVRSFSPKPQNIEI